MIANENGGKTIGRQSCLTLYKDSPADQEVFGIWLFPFQKPAVWLLGISAE